MVICGGANGQMRKEQQPKPIDDQADVGILNARRELFDLKLSFGRTGVPVTLKETGDSSPTADSPEMKRAPSMGDIARDIAKMEQTLSATGKHRSPSGSLQEQAPSIVDEASPNEDQPPPIVDEPAAKHDPAPPLIVDEAPANYNRPPPIFLPVIADEAPSKVRSSARRSSKLCVYCCFVGDYLRLLLCSAHLRSWGERKLTSKAP